MINGLKITQVTVYPVRKIEGRLKAVARIVLNDCLVLTMIKVYEGSNGLFVSYPIEHSKCGEEFRQVFYPLRRETREYIEQEVLLEYSKICEEVA